MTVRSLRLSAIILTSCLAMACHEDTTLKADTGVKENFLLRKRIVERLSGIDFAKWSITKRWVHFRTKDGLTVSCLRDMEEYPNVSAHIDFSGISAEFPKNVRSSLEKAQIFTREPGSLNKSVRIDLSNNVMKIRGIGSSGSYCEKRKVVYSGKAVGFFIDPKLLVAISNKSNKFEISDGKIRVETDDFVYVACTYVVDEEN